MNTIKKCLGLALCAFLITSNAWANDTYPTLTENGKTYYIYTVQKSEGLYAISQRFGVPQALIIQANPGCDNGLVLGQSLKVPVIQDLSTTTNKAEANATAHFKQHLVQPKETLYGLSKKYNLSVDELLKYNPWATHLTIGAVLQIPMTAEEQTIAQQAVVEKEITTQQNTPIQPQELTELVNQAFENSNKAEQTTQTPADTVVKKESKFKLWAKRAFGKKDKKKKKADADDIFQVELTTTDTISADTLDQPQEQKSKWLFKKPVNHVNVAILLPFSLQAPARDASMDRFIEFYQGCILAFDSLAQQGLSINVHTYDIGRTPAKLDSVLAISQLKKVDLIIGPAYQSQVSAVAKFAKNNKINTVIPFASNIKEIAENPYLFEVVTPQKHLSLRISQKFCYYFNDKQVVLIIPSSVVAHNKYEFTQMLQDGMNKTDMQYITISDENMVAYTDSIASLTENEVIVVVPTSNEVMLNKLGEALSLMQQPNLAVLGLPEWNNLRIDELYSKKMYNFSSYQTQFKSPEVTHFFTQLTQKFGLPNRVQQTPNYAIFGFDICNFFLRQIQENGVDFASFLPTEEVHGLQMNFLFEQVQNGGYWNQGIILQTIDKNGIQNIE